MPVDLKIEHFPANPEGRQHCFVWKRRKDGERVVFGCDTQQNCEKMLTHFQDRARLADEAGSETM